MNKSLKGNVRRRMPKRINQTGFGEKTSKGDNYDLGGRIFGKVKGGDD